MPTITVASSKGGAGKTTIARLLLGHAVQYGRKAAALDADLNHSLLDWVQQFSKHRMTAVAELDESKIPSTIEALERDHDFVVIDTPGAATRATVFCIGAADLVLVPLKLSSADFTEAVKTVKVVEATCQMLGRKVPVRLVLTGYKPRTSIAQHVEAEVAAAKLPVMATKLHDLVAFEEMTFSGIIPVVGGAGMLTASLYDEAMALIEPKRAARKLAS